MNFIQTVRSHVQAGTVPALPPRDVFNLLRGEKSFDVRRSIDRLNGRAANARNHIAEVVALVALDQVL